MNYKQIYLNHFELTQVDFIIDEYEYIVNDNIVQAENIHHIFFGANKHDHINNLMALSFDNHTKAHQELLKRDYLKEIHIEFLNKHNY